MSLKHLNDPRIKRVPAHACQQGKRLLTRHALAIRPVAARGVIEVDDRDDSSNERYPFSFQTLWVTTAVPFLMVIANNVFDWVREVDAFEDIATDSRVNLHFGELRFS